MSRSQLLLWIGVGAVVGLGVGAFMDNVLAWVLIGMAMGLSMGWLQARFDPDARS